MSDIYSETAAKIYDVPVSAVTAHQRRWAKLIVNFRRFSSGPPSIKWPCDHANSLTIDPRNGREYCRVCYHWTKP